MSYFLWSTMPDDPLARLADEGRLRDEAVLRTQVQRMLADPKADALIDNFAAQWLYLRTLTDVQPDYAAFPAWTEELRQAMRTETQLTLRELFRGAGTLDQLLLGEFTFVNARLAQFYGLPAQGGTFARVSLAGTPRRGVLTQGSLLTVTSYPTRTSPVKRGKWVLEQLLCSAPPPPPPGVEGLTDSPGARGSIRQRLEEHRKNPVCASCHSLMDPIGFGLENFSGIGAYRTMDNGAPVDASGKLPDGRTFAGARELAGLLATDPRFPRCTAEKLYTYALGRGPEELDQERLQALGNALVKSGYKAQDLITSIVLSETFRFRRGEPVQGGAR
jgi:hypothetical protein